MVQATEYRTPFDCAQRRDWRLEAQCTVGPRQVVVLDKLGADRPEMLLVEDDEMVLALAL
jgi:hypothetical protein